MPELRWVIDGVIYGTPTPTDCVEFAEQRLAHEIAKYGDENEPESLGRHDVRMRDVPLVRRMLQAAEDLIS